jgi:hypothetical protein
MKRALAACLIVAATLLAACGDTTTERTASGAGVGALAGAGTGALLGPVGMGTGALVGAGVGAGAGYAGND